MWPGRRSLLTSQGISFLHAGTEFLRSKKGIENSYNAPDSINEIDWTLKTLNHNVFTYVQQLIKMRRAHPAFRMQTAKQVQANLHFFETAPGVIGYQLNGAAVKDSWKDIQVWFNGTDTEKILPLPTTSGWKAAVINNTFIENASINGAVLQPYSCIVLYRE